jgi:hypothetical protein
VGYFAFFSNLRPFRTDPPVTPTPFRTRKGGLNANVAINCHRKGLSIVIASKAWQSRLDPSVYLRNNNKSNRIARQWGYRLLSRAKRGNPVFVQILVFLCYPRGKLKDLPVGRRQVKILALWCFAPRVRKHSPCCERSATIRYSSKFLSSFVILGGS